MNHAYKLFAAAVVLIAIVFGSMEVSYRAAADTPPAAGAGVAKGAQPNVATPKPVIIPAPNAPTEFVDASNPGVPPAIELSKDQAPPPASAPSVSAEGTEPAPMIIIPAQEN
jgi:hypothetical protein